ncbi:MAG: hypothetical protein OSJ70_01335 [Bacilli bacterium]|nr:hypothetical protein [Bacilli bacterium]
MLPNKVIGIKESILWKLPDVIEIIKNNANLCKAYHQVEKKKIDIYDFEYTIDILYLLDMIEIIDEEGNYKYVG